jgi:hypothetical protein
MGGGECREEPTDLPLLELGEWILAHPPTSYFPDADAGPSDGEVIEAVGKGTVGHVVGDGAEHVTEMALGIEVPFGWLFFAYELFESAAHQLEADELPEKRRQAQLEAWGGYLAEKFWSDEAEQRSRDAREAAFDALVGDNAGHGVVPALTAEAEARRQELIDQINDRWLEKMEAINDQTRALERLEADTPENAAERARHSDYAAHLRSEAAELRTAIAAGARVWETNGASEGYWRTADPERDGQQAEALEAAATAEEHQVDTSIHVVESQLESRKAALMDDMKKDVQSVMDFDATPGNWDLTAEQKALLACDAPAQPNKPADEPHHSRHQPRPA